MNGKLFAFLMTGFLSLLISSPVKGETVLEAIQRTGVVKVAIREDAAPFGYLDRQRNLRGYCLDFFVLLENKLLETLSRNSLIFQLLKSTSDNRFSLVANQTIELECGPNTIRSEVPNNVQFSTPFFLTGTQFLVKEADTEKLDLDGNLEDLRIGVISNTTTAEFLAERYPLAKLEKFRGTTGRTRGVQALQQGKIDAMVSDGVLLRAEAQLQSLSQQDYPLIPETPITCDRYGMIITANDPEWKSFIDSVILSPEAVALSARWFASLDNYTKPTRDYCEAD